MIFNEKTIKIFSVIAILVTIGVSVPQHEARAGLIPGVPDPVVEIGPNLWFNTITSGVTTALNIFTTFIQPVFTALVKTLIRRVIADLKNQTIQWIVTGQFDMPQFVSSFQVDPRKIAENASRIFLSRLTNINFCNYQPPAYNSNLLFSANLSLTLDCTFPQNLDFTKFRKDWRNGGWTALWAATDPQNNYWDVVNRAIVQKQIAENKSLSAWYNEILTNAGMKGLTDNKGKIVTPGGYLSQALNSTIEKSYPDIGQIGTDPASLINAVTQAIGEIVDAGLKKAIQTGLTTAFK